MTPRGSGRRNMQSAALHMQLLLPNMKPSATSIA
jgi:hypothetical protein